MGANYFIRQILPLVFIGALYLLIIFGLIVLFVKAKVPRGNAIILACLLFGVAMGLITVWFWPDDVSAVANFPAAFLGDWIYQSSIQYIGDPHSPQAHYTIPWLLRVPQVYFLASVSCWGAVGAITQLIYNVATRRKPTLMKKKVD